MPTISQIKIGNSTYDIHDAKALPSNADANYALAIKNQSNEFNILTVDWNGNEDTHSASHAGTERPANNTSIQRIDSYDSEDALIGYSQIVLTNNGIYRSYAVRNPTTNEAVALYLRAFDNGTKQLALSSGTTIADSAIPSLAASKIGSGTFSADRIPTLAIGTKTSGTLARNRGGTGVTQVTSGTVTPQNNTTFTINSCYHNGIVATIYLKGITLANTLTSGQGVVIGTVPAGFQPNNEAYAMVCDPNKMYVGIYCRITSGGELRLYNYAYSEDTLPKSKSLGAVTFTYVTKT